MQSQPFTKNLSTERLFLRQPRLSDSTEIFTSYSQDPDVTKYMIWKPHKSETETQDFLKFVLQAWELETEFHYVIENVSHDLIGMCSVIVKPPVATIGYVLAKRFWGQGFATEVTKKLIETSFEHPEITRIEISCDVDNKASERVIQKNGLHFVHTVPGLFQRPNISSTPRDGKLYALDKTQN